MYIFLYFFRRNSMIKVLSNFIPIIIVILLFILPSVARGQVSEPETLIFDTDRSGRQLHAFFDLRDRESFVQVTNTDTVNPYFVHMQIFTVNANCTENDFFDFYTQNDTHVYNMRDILSNDGNPSGVVLPENAYGIVVFSALDSIDSNSQRGNTFLIGNVRIEDNNGYEYRTNLTTPGDDVPPRGMDRRLLTFNFSGDITLSDVVGLTLDNAGPDNNGVSVDDLNDAVVLADVDLFNLDEVPFSCRNVIFACVDENSPRISEILGDIGGASVVNFEYGVNEAIPSSKGAPLLCPSNVVDEGFVRLTLLDEELDLGGRFVLFVGLNNGNGRGTMDTHWRQNRIRNMMMGDG